MNTKQLLIKCITLLYREHQIPNNTTHSEDLLVEILETIKMPPVIVEGDRQHHIILGLTQYIRQLLKVSPDLAYDRNDVLQEVCLIADVDQSIYKSFETGLREETLTKEQLLTTCTQLRRQLKTYLSEHQIKKILKDKAREVSKLHNNQNWKDVARETMESLAKYISDDGESEYTPSYQLGYINLDNDESVTKALEKAAFDENANVLQFGLQDLNDMCGPERQGVRVGEMVQWYALPFNFKSGLSNMTFCQIACFNEASKYLNKDEKDLKPLLYYIVAENDLGQNINWIFCYLYENEHNVGIDPKTFDVDFKKTYIKERLQRQGWSIIIESIDPTDYTYSDYYQAILSLKNRGYKVVACWFDYLNKISKRGCTLVAGTGSDIKNLFHRIRVFNQRHGITFFTPHQLSNDAKMYLREGRTDFVKEVAGKGFFDGCKGLDQEADLDFYLHIESYNGHDYLTIQRGKHRKFRNTPEEYLYRAWRFDPIGTIPPDIGKEKSGLTNFRQKKVVKNDLW